MGLKIPSDKTPPFTQPTPKPRHSKHEQHPLLVRTTIIPAKWIDQQVGTERNEVALDSLPISSVRKKNHVNIRLCHSCSVCSLAITLSSSLSNRVWLDSLGQLSSRPIQVKNRTATATATAFHNQSFHGTPTRKHISNENNPH